MGAQFVENGKHQKVLVVGADVMTSILNFEDRATCVLFGDGAGAVLLEPSSEEEAEAGRDHPLDAHLHRWLRWPQRCRFPAAAEGAVHGGRARQQASPRAHEQAGHVQGSHPDLSRLPRRPRSRPTASATHGARLGRRAPGEHPHLSGVSQRLEIPMERFYINIHKYGNTSSASIGIALDEAVSEGKIKPGQTILMCALGAGISRDPKKP